MTELEKLTELIGTPTETAKALGITVRSYWNYKVGNIPVPMRELIKLKLQECAEGKSKP